MGRRRPRCTHRTGLALGFVTRRWLRNGRYAYAFSRLGHRVTLLDASPNLLAIAARRCPSSPAYQDDICAPEISGPIDAIACRGVLNDLVLDDERDAALRAIARLLRLDGLVALDVREATASRARADGRPRTKEVTRDDGSSVRFTSISTWQADRLVVQERHHLIDAAGEVTLRDYLFHMRPWTSKEIRARLTAAGFSHVEIAPGVGGRADRLFVTARSSS